MSDRSDGDISIGNMSVRDQLGRVLSAKAHARDVDYAAIAVGLDNSSDANAITDELLWQID